MKYNSIEDYNTHGECDPVVEDSLESQYRDIIKQNWMGTPVEASYQRVLKIISECLEITPSSDMEAVEVLIRLIQFLESKTQSTALALDCLKYVFEISPESQIDIAAKHGVVKATVSKICVNLTNEFNTTCRGMKAKATRETYSEAQKNKVNKKSGRKELWEVLG